MSVPAGWAGSWASCWSPLTGARAVRCQGPRSARQTTSMPRGSRGTRSVMVALMVMGLTVSSVSARGAWSMTAPQ